MNRSGSEILRWPLRGDRSPAPSVHHATRRTEYLFHLNDEISQNRHSQCSAPQAHQKSDAAPDRASRAWIQLSLRGSTNPRDAGTVAHEVLLERTWYYSISQFT